MGIEDFKTNTEGDKQNFSEKIENIKKRLESGEGDKQELSDEFLKLWKEAPDNIDDSAHANIDSIRALLVKSTEGDKQNFSEKIENIKKRLESGEGDKQELSDEFLKLWKEAPDNIDDSAHADIDSIRALLM